MNDKDFILRLTNSFEIPEVTQNDILEWVNQAAIESHNLKYLYNKITRCYKYRKLNLAAIIDFWNTCLNEFESNRIAQNVNAYSDDWIIEHTKNWSVLEIYNKCCEIRKTHWSGIELPAKYICFMHTWDNLYHDFGMLKDKGWSQNDIIHHCEFVKSERIKGVKRSFVPEEKPGTKDIKLFDEIKQEGIYGL